MKWGSEERGTHAGGLLLCGGWVGGRSRGLVVPSSLLACYASHLDTRVRAFLLDVLVVWRVTRRLCGSHWSGWVEGTRGKGEVVGASRCWFDTRVQSCTDELLQWERNGRKLKRKKCSLWDCKLHGQGRMVRFLRPGGQKA